MSVSMPGLLGTDSGPGLGINSLNPGGPLRPHVADGETEARDPQLQCRRLKLTADLNSHWPPGARMWASEALNRDSEGHSIETGCKVQLSEAFFFFFFLLICAFCKPKPLTVCLCGVCTKAQLVFKRKQ